MHVDSEDDGIEALVSKFELLCVRHLGATILLYRGKAYGSVSQHFGPDMCAHKFDTHVEISDVAPDTARDIYHSHVDVFEMRLTIPAEHEPVEPVNAVQPVGVCPETG